MNKQILNTAVQDFINTNLKQNINTLLLKGSPFNNVSIQEIANQITCKQKAQKKLPTWFATKNIYYPSKVNIEQTSSEITAQYKSSLVTGKNIIDITGGLGIDAFYFAKTFNHVTHCEINERLSNIVRYNYQQLNVKNIRTIAKDGLSVLKEYSKNIDCIYIDPSRRNELKKKVFLLKDCLPDVPKNIDFLFSKTSTILIKTAPMLDISNGIKELKYVKEIHIIAIKNEVKELLFLLEKNYNNTIVVKTSNFLKTHQQNFNFKLNSTSKISYSLPQTYLYEPNSAILKSGGFSQVAHQLNVQKIEKNAHLYTSKELIEKFPGRKFKIITVLNYNKKQLKTIKKANITTRNFPETVAQIRKKTKIKEGGETYLFFTTNLHQKLIIIVTQQVF